MPVIIFFRRIIWNNNFVSGEIYPLVEPSGQLIPTRPLGGLSPAMSGDIGDFQFGLSGSSSLFRRKCLRCVEIFGLSLRNDGSLCRGKGRGEVCSDFVYGTRLPPAEFLSTTPPTTPSTTIIFHPPPKVPYFLPQCHGTGSGFSVALPVPLACSLVFLMALS